MSRGQATPTRRTAAAEAPQSAPTRPQG